MLNNSNKKLYKSQGALIQQCQLMANAVERDLSTLKDYEITNKMLQSFINDTKAYTEMPNDDMIRSKLKKQSEEKKQLRKLLNEQAQFILSRAGNLYDSHSADYSYFGMQGYYKAKEADMVRQCRMLVVATTERLSELARRNVHQADLDLLVERVDAYDLSMKRIHEAKLLRKQARMDRTKAGLSLQARLYQFADLGKIVWRRMSPAKYLDYVING